MSAATARVSTPSLRRRVTLLVLVLLGTVLVVLVLVTDAALGSRLEGQLRQRLVDRAVIGSALSGQVDPRDLARRLEGDGVSAVVTDKNGNVYAEGPLGGAVVQESSQGSSPSSQGSTSGSDQQSTPAQPSESANPGGPKDPPSARGGAGPRATPPTPREKATDADVVQSGERLSITRTLSDGSKLQLLADATDVRRTLDQVRLVLGLTAGGVLMVAALVVPLVVSRGMRPLRQITEVAGAITEGDRSRRLRPPRPGTDLGRTARAFDTMLDDVVGAEEQARESEARLRAFLSDAAHELRTPLTGVQAGAEHLLRADPPRDQREQHLLDLIRETRRAGRLVDDMLLMARIDRGLAFEPAPTDLLPLLERVVSARLLTHPDASLTVSGPAVVVTGDAERLLQVVGNVVDNAVRAAGPRGQVALCTWHHGELAGVDVSDDGPGIPAADRERVFERLVRLDDARGRRDGGSGLGLPIARGIARAHGGDLVALDPGASGGALLRLSLPASTASTAAGPSVTFLSV